MRWRTAVFVCLILALLALPAFAGTSKVKPSATKVVYPSATAESPAFRDLPVVTPEECQGEPREVEDFTVPKAQAKPYAPGENAPDPVVQSVHGVANMPAPLISFEGINNTYGVYPPDTEGDIGPNHYVQWVNLGIQGWTIDRGAWTATTAFGPVNGNTIWTPLGGPCATMNDGDPIVLWDRFRSRWVISQFAVDSTPYRQAIAISKTADPAGEWWLYCYDWDATKFNDYPKFGVWPDGYYMTVNQFTTGWAGAGVAVFEADKMINGDPTARMLKVDLGAVNLNWGSMLPAHFEGMSNPPASSPCYFVEVDDSTWIPGLTNDTISLWKATVDWTAGTFTVGSGGNPDLQLAVADFTPLPCIGGCRDAIPQPGTSVKLDSLGDRAMYRLQYRNYGSYESMVFNHTVMADASGDRAGVRWYELRKEGVHATWYVYQQGTYGPSDGLYRWMGSAAQDHVGNLAIGYSISDGSTTYPSIAYAGRLASDPAGTLPQAEVVLHAGSGYQSGSGHRWGDYSTISVDPVDDCTFWYTTEYIQTNGTAPWRTRIGAWKYANCSIGPTGTLTGTVTAAVGGTPIVGATVSAFDGVNTIQTLSGPGGVYTMTLPVATYNVTASAFGYNPQTVNGIAITDGVTTTQNFSLTSSATHTIDGTVTDTNTGWPLYATIDITGDMGYPGTTIYTNPATGYYSITLVDGVTYNLTATPWVSGYVPGAASVGPLAADTTQDFALDVTTGCNGPGYKLTGVSEDFSGTSLPAGWTVVNNGGDCVWTFNNPGGRTNETGGSGNFAIADSDYCFIGTYMNTELRTPVMDFSSLGTVTLQFKYDFHACCGQIGDVDVSVNGAAGPWTNVWSDSSNDRGPVTVTIDISSVAGNHSNVMVRFHYYDAYWDYWWEIDDVLIGSPGCTPPAGGGLIYGNVYDANTMNALAGATVDNSTTGGTVTTAVTPDPAVDDGFYCMYGAEGANTMSATKALYGTDNQSATVPHFGVVERNFTLGSAQLAVSPPSLSWTTVTGGTGGDTLTLSNIGGAGATFEVKEMNGHVAAPFKNLFAFNRRPHLTKAEMLTQAFHNEREQEAAERGEAKEARGTKIEKAVSPNSSDTASGTDSPSPVGTPGSYFLKPGGQNPPSFSILAYVDDWVHTYPNTYPEQALTRLGFPASIYHDGDYTGFETALTSGGPWDLVIWQGENYNISGYPTLMTSLLNYVQGGGKLVCTYWRQLDYPADPLWAAMGFQYVSNYVTPPPTYWWDPGHPIFTNPESAPEWLVRVQNSGTSQGTRLEPLANGIALGGYTTSPAPNEAGLVLRDDGKTLYKGLRDVSTNADADLDGVPDGVELWENIIYGLLNGFDVPWLDENPKTGSVAAGNSTDIDVTYDATGLAPGTYEATVSFSNDTPYGPLNVPVTLTVAPPVVPVATADVTSGNAPLTVNFTGTATGGVGDYSYDWDFGDGSPHSTDQNPAHTYNIGGDFTVALTVTASVAGVGVDDHLVISVVPPPIPIVNNFYDNLPRNLEQACFNRLTGAYVWTVLSGPHAGLVLTGTAKVFNGGAKYTNLPGDPNGYFSVTFDPVRHKASGYMISGGVYYPLYDSNTLDNPPGCY